MRRSLLRSGPRQRGSLVHSARGSLVHWASLVSGRGVLACPFGLLRIGERPAVAFDQLGRDVRIVDVGCAHALLQLKGTPIVPGRDAVRGFRVRHDDDAWRVLPSFRSNSCALVTIRLTNPLHGAAGRVHATPGSLQIAVTARDAGNRILREPPRRAWPAR